MDDGQTAGGGPMRVFVYEYLSGGGRVDGDEAATAALMPLGLAMRDALVGDLLRGGDCTLTVAASPGAGAVPPPGREVRPWPDESPFDFVARQAALHDAAWVIAPETAGLLAQMERVVGPARWVGCDARAIALATGKRATLLRLREHGIPTPLAFDTPGTAAWIVKPDDGAGGVDMRLHDRRDDALADARRAIARGMPMTVEPFVDGEPLSLSLACGGGAAELLSINRQHIGRERGRVFFHGVDVNALPVQGERGRALQALATRVAGAIDGLDGFVGIDLVWHAERGPVVIEVNPRVTFALVGLSAALGRNVGAGLLRSWCAAHGVGADRGVHA